jgi:uncharacterized protein (DUF1501 family)
MTAVKEKRHKVLVVVFQRGAMDGLNAVIPFKESGYYAARPNLTIAEPASGEEHAIDLDGFYALHPALAPLKELYAKGYLAMSTPPGRRIIRALISTPMTTWKSVRRD